MPCTVAIRQIGFNAEKPLPTCGTGPVFAPCGGGYHHVSLTGAGISSRSQPYKFSRRRSVPAVTDPAADCLFDAALYGTEIQIVHMVWRAGPGCIQPAGLPADGCPRGSGGLHRCPSLARAQYRTDRIIVLRRCLAA